MEVVKLGQLAVGLEKGLYTAYFISTNIALDVLIQEVFTNKLLWKMYTL